MSSRPEMPLFVLIGFGLIFIGVLVIALGSLLSVPDNEGIGQSRVAVGGFFGPIPFGFANEKPMLYVVLGISTFIIVLFLVWRYLG